jgi:hypothetical protein
MGPFIFTPVPRLDNLFHTLRPIPVPQLMGFGIGVDPFTALAFYIEYPEPEELKYLKRERGLGLPTYVQDDIEGQCCKSWWGSFGGIWVGEIDLREW